MLESVRTLVRSVNKNHMINFKALADKNTSCLLNTVPSTFIPSRTTVIVKRLFPPTLHKEGNKVRLRRRTFFYDYVEETNNRPEPLIDVVLSSYVQGIGNPGDIISMKRSAAYNKLLVPGFADYVTPEMIEYSRKTKEDEAQQKKHISPSVDRCMRYLQKATISVVMNQSHEWTIEPWHIRVSARKAGIHILSDSCIELPPRPIRGPDMSLERKGFFVTVTINKKTKVKVRCSIHHWTAVAADRLPFVPEWWVTPPEMIFPEDEELNKEVNSKFESPS